MPSANLTYASTRKAAKAAAARVRAPRGYVVSVVRVERREWRGGPIKVLWHVVLHPEAETARVRITQKDGSTKEYYA